MEAPIRNRHVATSGPFGLEVLIYALGTVLLGLPGCPAHVALRAFA